MNGRHFIEWMWSVAAVVVCTVVAWVLTPYLSATDQAMLYFVGTVIVASRTGAWPSFLAVVLSIAAFNFFFVPPRFTFEVYDRRYVVTFAVMFIVAFAISRLTNQVRKQAEESGLRERQTNALYEMSRDLLRERDPGLLQAIIARHIGKALDGSVQLFLFDQHGGLVFPSDGLGEREREAVRWAAANRQPAGAAILNGPDAEGTYVPLIASRGIVGVVGVNWHTRKDSIEARELRFLDAFAQQAAAAIERAELAEEAHEALRKVETERLRNTLLSSLSHDLRTPLTAVAGAVSTLIDNERAVDANSRRELLLTIQEEAARLHAMIRNVLDLTRLESGAIQVRKEWQSLEEIIGAVLTRMERRLASRRIVVQVPPDLPLVPFDALLIEQVLTNLVENALKYAPESPIELSATADPVGTTIVIEDRGPGIPAGDEVRIFDKFVRASAVGGGIGLGLAICRSIVQAHGGRIWAENRPGGGAAFRFTLPVEEQPPSPKTEMEVGPAS